MKFHIFLYGLVQNLCIVYFPCLDHGSFFSSDLPTKAKKNLVVESSEIFMTGNRKQWTLTEKTYAEKVVMILTSDHFLARKRKGVAVSVCTRWSVTEPS